MPTIEIVLLVVWGLVTITCIIVEVFTNNFITMWFAFGGFVTIFINVGGLIWYWQLLTFILVSFVSLIIGYPILRKKIFKKENIKTNIDSLINQQAVMLNDYDPQDNKNIGIAKLDGKNWTVTSDQKNIFKKDEEVLVANIVGVKLVIQKIKE